MKSGKNCVQHSKTAVGVAFLSGIAALAIQVPPASAADYGVGAVHQGSGNTVLLPIKLDTLLVEPEVLLSKVSGDSSSTSVGLATGIYGRKDLGPLFEGYMGGRVGLSHFKSNSTFGGFPSDNKNDSWLIGPVAGVQHYFSKVFSIGLDVGLIYTHSKIRSTSLGIVTTQNNNAVNTQTRILLRAYF
jgi:hypothetical protein